MTQHLEIEKSRMQADVEAIKRPASAVSGQNEWSGQTATPLPSTITVADRKVSLTSASAIYVALHS